MEDILTSIQKQSENLDIKHEDSWETEAGFHDVTVGANLKGNITHFNENTHNDIDQDTQEPSETNVFLINLEIGSKTIENVSISRDCQLQDVAEELAQDEMVKVVYFLHEKITKGGNNFDASEAQVLVKLRSNWNWICIDELVDDSTMTIEEVFSNMPDYFKPLFSLAPKVNRKTEPQAGQPVITDTCSQSSLASFTGHTTGRSIKNSDENPGIRLITELKDLLAKHNISELLKKDSQLGKKVSFSHVRWMAKFARKAAPLKNNIKKKSTREYTRVQKTTKQFQNPKPNGKIYTKTTTSGTNCTVNRERRTIVDEPVASVSSGPREVTIEATSKNPAFIPDDELNFKQRVSSFEALGLRHDVLKALDAMNIRQPTVIQMVTVPSILQRRHVLSAAQTGSGKTIAYLAPIVHHLREDEQRHGMVARLQRPRACVVVPARELAMQVLKVAKSFCHYARFRSIGLIGGRKQKWVREDLQKPVDLMVATPGTLLKYRQKDRLFFSDLTHLVIDEADTMFDSSFKNLTMEILHTVNVRESKPPPAHHLPIATQVTIVGATLPDELIVSTLSDVVPGLTKCTSGLHRVLPHIQHRFIKMNQKDKADKLIQLLQKDSRQGCRTIVFCNSTSSCDWLGHYLNKYALKFIRLHGNIPPQIRCERFEEFQDQVADILICTDIASRGLDTSDVSHVINFDFPNSVVDYIHRVGRTGRVTNTPRQVTCRATSFVTHNRDARMARTIEIAAKKSESLSLEDSKKLHDDDTRIRMMGK